MSCKDRVTNVMSLVSDIYGSLVTNPYSVYIMLLSHVFMACEMPSCYLRWCLLQLKRRNAYLISSIVHLGSNNYK